MYFRISTTALMASLLAVTVTAQSNTADADPQQPTNSPGAGVQLRSFQALGCFSNPGDMWDMGPYTFQTNGWCQPLCVRQKATYFALVNGTNCFCGNEAPPSSKKVSSSECDVTCSGFDTQNCGGNNRWAVYSDGYRNGDNIGTISITTPSQTWSVHATTETAKSGFKTVTGPNTVYVTATDGPSAAAESSAPIPTGPNKAAIAAGVVVGVVVLSTAIGGAIFARRFKKNKELEEERRRHDSIMRIVQKGEKPPSFSAGSDSRIDPGVMFQRRQSNGSIMEDQDFSPRVLKVTNPDNRSSGVPWQH